jgi:hypothetical protein
MMKRLLENKDFQEFVTIARAQVEGHLQQLRHPLEKHDDVFLQEYRKGIVFGLETLLTTPAAIVKTADDLLRKEQDDAARRKQHSLKPDPNAGSDEQRGVVTADSNLEPDS